MIAEKFADLHIHTNCSDGVFTPSEVVSYAKNMGLSAISITDHDSVDGVQEALSAGADSGVEVIPGIELSSLAHDGSEMHILGYFINHKCSELGKKLKFLRKDRFERGHKILQKLENCGVKLKDTSFLRSGEDKAVGRLHFAKALVAEGAVKNTQEAFQKYLSPEKPAYVAKYAMSAAEAIKLISDAGGISVMAHPYYSHYTDMKIMHSLVAAGLSGIEAYHPKHPESMVKKFLALAKDLGIAATGGSDCHGASKNEPAMLGRIKIPYLIVENLKKIKQQQTA